MSNLNELIFVEFSYISDLISRIIAKQFSTSHTLSDATNKS